MYIAVLVFFSRNFLDLNLYFMIVSLFAELVHTALVRVDGGVEDFEFGHWVAAYVLCATQYTLSALSRAVWYSLRATLVARTCSLRAALLARL